MQGLFNGLDGSAPQVMPGHLGNVQAGPVPAVVAPPRSGTAPAHAPAAAASQ